MSGELRDELPYGVDIEANGADVVVRFGGFSSRNGTASILDVEDGRPFIDRLVTATRAVISHVQDVAADASTMLWPASGSTLPLPQAEVVDGRLRAWFGDRGNPVLALTEVDAAAFAPRPLA